MAVHTTKTLGIGRLFSAKVDSEHRLETEKLIRYVETRNIIKAEQQRPIKNYWKRFNFHMEYDLPRKQDVNECTQTYFPQMI